METPYGLRGSVIPKDSLKNYKEAFIYGVFNISTENGVVEIGYEDALLEDEARSLINLYITTVGFEIGQKLAVDLNTGWKKNINGGKDIHISVAETIHVHAELQSVTMTANISGKAFIVHASDTRSLNQRTDTVKKALHDKNLASALHYFNEEVTLSDKPLYGIYKALEALTEKLGKNGREKLGNLVGRNKKYVDDIMQTAQITRHYNDPAAKLVLTDSECKARAKELISAYIASLV